MRWVYANCVSSIKLWIMKVTAYDKGDMSKQSLTLPLKNVGMKYNIYYTIYIMSLLVLY